MTGHYRVTHRANRDLREIARYSLKIWGRRQRDVYLRDLVRRFEWLAANPGFGRRRDDIAPGYCSYPQGSHVVFYIVRHPGLIDIIGVPHAAMDHSSYFGDESLPR